jgi:hypothetical protein
LAFFARWAYEYPDSRRLRIVLTEVREGLGVKKEELSPEKLQNARAFFGGQLATSRFTAKMASEMTYQFMTHYNHAIPFNPAVLEAIWKRCRGPRCASARSEVGRELGLQTDEFRGLPTTKQGDATQYLASPPETNPATLSPNPESDPDVNYR